MGWTPRQPMRYAVVMRIEMLYGGKRVEAELDWGRCLGVLDVRDAPPLEDAPAALRDGLRHPIGMDAPALARFQPGDSVLIVVSDSFRKTAIDHVLPALLDALRGAGIRGEDISFLFSTGTHRPPTEAEAREILGAAVHAAFAPRVYGHDPRGESGLVTLGATSRGTPVTLSRRYVEAARTIVTGTVVLHYFAGYGGGHKAVLPGLASEAAVAHNHALNLDKSADRIDPSVRIGVTEGNPVAEDMLEAARFHPPDLLINTVLNGDGAIAGLFTGEMEAAHREAADFARGLYAVAIEERADLVIASAGAAKNYLQSHKALFNAYQAVKPEGRIVFLAEAPEGLGGNKLAAWLRLGEPAQIMAALRERAEINGQTALSTREKARRAVLVTALSEADSTLIGARKAASLGEALAWCRAAFEKDGIVTPSFYVLPSASQSVPML